MFGAREINGWFGDMGEGEGEGVFEIEGLGLEVSRPGSEERVSESDSVEDGGFCCGKRGLVEAEGLDVFEGGAGE